MGDAEVLHQLVHGGLSAQLLGWERCRYGGCVHLRSANFAGSPLTVSTMPLRPVICCSCSPVRHEQQ